MDILGDNLCEPIIKDDPILADGKAQQVGQPIFIVVAEGVDITRKACRKAKVDYQDLPNNLTDQITHHPIEYQSQPEDRHQFSPHPPMKSVNCYPTALS